MVCCMHPSIWTSDEHIKHPNENKNDETMTTKQTKQRKPLITPTKEEYSTKTQWNGLVPDWKTIIRLMSRVRFPRFPLFFSLFSFFSSLNKPIPSLLLQKSQSFHDITRLITRLTAITTQRRRNNNARVMKNEENDKTKKEKTTKDKKEGQSKPTQEEVPFCIAKSVPNTSQRSFQSLCRQKRAHFGIKRRQLWLKKDKTTMNNDEQRWTKFDMMKMYKTISINR